MQPFEIAELGDVSGLDLVHLQCHIGLDTLSWARLGARVTGVDFSAPAVEAAQAMAEELGVEATFDDGTYWPAGDARASRSCTRCGDASPTMLPGASRTGSLKHGTVIVTALRRSGQRCAQRAGAVLLGGRRREFVIDAGPPGRRTGG